MINIPINVDATLTEGGVSVYVWSGDADSDSEHTCWTTLINDLIEAYTIPNHRGKVLISAGDYDFLVEVLQGLQGASSYFLERLDKVEIA